MKKTVPLSLLAILSLHAQEITLDTINIESTQITEVAQNAKVSADLAQTLESNIPSIDMSRRSGIANDILIRGQKRDNISINVDGTKVKGACPNRMDPPVSHILASQIQSVDVIEGPYDVENFGVLSGGLTIKTKQPTKKEKVEASLGFGSFEYKKFGLSASGGNDLVRFLVTGSLQNSGQYEDGEGNTLAMQTKLKAPIINQYKPQYFDMDAYDKRSLMTKLFITTAKNQELRLGYTANRSNDVMYANTSMDAIFDDSNIYNIAYNIKDISDTYKNINLQYYYSDVTHPMSNEYRKVADINASKNITSALTTSMQGIKIKNDFIVAKSHLRIGLDHSRRTWNGVYYNNITGAPAMGGVSIDNAITKNSAIFAELSKTLNDFHIKIGARYDDSTVTNNSLADRDFSSFSANIMTTYNLNHENKFFIGLGKSSRIPDARELYFKKKGKALGTPTLNQTTNKEIDVGYETDNDNFNFKIKTFYSKLDNYIYFSKASTTNAFTNIDATLYGAEISGSMYAGDYATIDFGASYKRGKKDDTSSWQTDNLADIAPLRANIALNYEYANNSLATLETKISDRWDTIDAENGEQVLSGWAILNAKIKHAVSKKFDLTIGINNIFDKTYAMSNTYADLTLLSTGTNDKMLLNEPGRYFYTNLDFRF